MEFMRVFLRTLLFVSRISLIVASLVMFFALTPQPKLEKALNILPATVAGAQKVFMTLPFSEHRVFVSAYLFPTLLLIGNLTLLLSARNGRDIIEALLKNGKAAAMAAIFLLLFLFTLTPRPPVIGGEITWYTVVYLLWTSLSFALFLYGMYPFLKALCRRTICYRPALWIWNWAKQVLFVTKPTFFLGVLFLIFFTLTNLSSYFLFEHIPHVKDSIAQVFHAKIFALGKLTVPSPEHREFFDMQGMWDKSTMINNGKWYSQYPPGHSFLLMLGILFNAPWVINPLLGSLTVVLLYFLGKELYDERTGRLSALLGMLSPFILFMSSEFMNHASALFFFTAFTLFFAKTMHAKRAYYAIIAGVCLGMILNIRPLTAFALALPFVFASGYLLMAQFRKYLLPMAAMMAAFLILAGVLLSFNYLTNGDPLLFGYVVLYGPEHLPGFGNAAWGEPHTPIQGLRHTLNDLNGLNKFLFEWPVPSLFFVFLLFVSLPRNKWDYLLFASFVSLVAIYFFYWFHNWCFGPRFFYESATALIVLTARGILRLPVLLRSILNLPVTIKKIHASVTAFVALSFFVGACSNIPALVQEYGNNYMDVNAEVLHAVKKKGIKKAIIFTRSSYTSVLPENSPLLDGDIIYARDLGEKNHLLMSAFPGYKYYLADGPNIQLLETK